MKQCSELTQAHARTHARTPGTSHTRYIPHPVPPTPGTSHTQAHARTWRSGALGGGVPRRGRSGWTGSGMGKGLAQQPLGRLVPGQEGWVSSTSASARVLRQGASQRVSERARACVGARGWVQPGTCACTCMPPPFLMLTRERACRRLHRLDGAHAGVRPHHVLRCMQTPAPEEGLTQSMNQPTPWTRSSHHITALPYPNHIHTISISISISISIPYPYHIHTISIPYVLRCTQTPPLRN